MPVNAKQLLFAHYDKIMPYGMILQIIYSIYIIICNNDEIVSAGMSINRILGRRPGEVVRCIHSDKEISGCGTSAYRMECTALGIIKKSIGTRTAVFGEAVITQRMDQNELPLNVYEHIQPIEINNDIYFFISLIDLFPLRVKAVVWEHIVLSCLVRST